MGTRVCWTCEQLIGCCGIESDELIVVIIAAGHVRDGEGGVGTVDQAASDGYIRIALHETRVHRSDGSILEFRWEGEYHLPDDVLAGKCRREEIAVEHTLVVDSAGTAVETCCMEVHAANWRAKIGRNHKGPCSLRNQIVRGLGCASVGSRNPITHSVGCQTAQNVVLEIESYLSTEERSIPSREISRLGKHDLLAPSTSGECTDETVRVGFGLSGEGLEGSVAVS